MNSYPSISSLISATKLSPDYDYLAKVILVGPSGAGKTSLLKYFINGHEYIQEHAPFLNQTIGVEFQSKLVQVGSHSLKLQIWDTAGQERFRSTTRNYYRDSAGVVLIYDINDTNSFLDLKDFMSDILCLTNIATISIVLFGNKSDVQVRGNPFNSLSEMVDDELVASFIDDYSGIVNITWLKGSIITGQNCTECFTSLSQSIITKLELGILDGISNGLQIGDMSSFSDYGSIHNSKLRKKRGINIAAPRVENSWCCC